MMNTKSLISSLIAIICCAHLLPLYVSADSSVRANPGHGDVDIDIKDHAYGARVYQGLDQVGFVDSSGRVYQGLDQVGFVDSSGRVYKGLDQVGFVDSSGRVYKSLDQVGFVDSSGRIYQDLDQVGFVDSYSKQNAGGGALLLGLLGDLTADVDQVQDGVEQVLSEQANNFVESANHYGSALLFVSIGVIAGCSMAQCFGGNNKNDKYEVLQDV